MDEIQETSNVNITAPIIRISKIIDDDRNTRLHLSAAVGIEENVATDLESEPRVDVENYLGWTPLMMACRKGHLNVAKLLLDHKADATKKNKFGKSVLMMSIASGNLEVVHLILQHLLCGGVSRQSMEKTFSPLSLAILFCYQDILKYLIEQNFSINASTPVTGLTPLMFASGMENCEGFTLLLAKGADPNIRNYLGITAHDITRIRNEKLEEVKQAQVNKVHVQPQQLCQIAPQQYIQPQCPVKLQPQIQPQPQPDPSLAPQPHPQQVPYIVISPQPSFYQLPSNHPMMLNPHVRKSSDTMTPSPNYYYANMTPITPLNYMPQMFFPPEFSPGQYFAASPAPNMYGTNDFLNVRMNQSNMYMSPMPPMMESYPSPCM